MSKKTQKESPAELQPELAPVASETAQEQPAEAAPEAPHETAPESAPEAETAQAQEVKKVTGIILFAIQAGDEIIEPGGLVTLTETRAQELEKSGDIDLNPDGVAFALSTGKLPTVIE